MAQHYVDRPRQVGIGTGVTALQPYAINWNSAIGAGFVATAVFSLMGYFLPQLMGELISRGVEIASSDGPPLSC